MVMKTIGHKHHILKELPKRVLFTLPTEKRCLLDCISFLVHPLVMIINCHSYNHRLKITLFLAIPCLSWSKYLSNRWFAVCFFYLIYYLGSQSNKIMMEVIQRNYIVFSIFRVALRGKKYIWFQEVSFLSVSLGFVWWSKALLNSGLVIRLGFFRHSLTKKLAKYWDVLTAEGEWGTCLCLFRWTWSKGGSSGWKIVA